MDWSAGIRDPTIKAFAQFIASQKFQVKFERFFYQNAMSFRDSEEQELEYMNIYREFQQMFNAEMDDFLSQQKLTEEDFQDTYQKILDQANDAKAAQYLNIVLASMDYKAFYKLMLSVQKKIIHRKRAEDKSDDAKSDWHKSTEKESDSKAIPKAEEKDSKDSEMKKCYAAKDEEK